MKQKILFLAPRLHPNYLEVFQELNKINDSYYVVVGNTKEEFKNVVLKKQFRNNKISNNNTNQLALDKIMNHIIDDQF